MVSLSRRHLVLLTTIILLGAGLCIYFLAARPDSSPTASSSALPPANSSGRPDLPRQRSTSQVAPDATPPATAIRDDESAKYDKRIVADLDAMAPGMEMLPGRRPGYTPPKSDKPLTGADRELATRLLQGLDEYFKSIKMLKMDFSLTSSAMPSLDMTGQLVSAGPGQFTFKGRINGNTVACTIYYDEGTGFIQVRNGKDATNLELRRDFSELDEHLWMRPLRAKGFVDRLRSLRSEQEVEIYEGKPSIKCTILESEISAFFFESSTGRLLRTTCKHPEQQTVSTFEYAGEENYPVQVTLYHTDTKRKTVFKHNNLELEKNATK
jgi:hypothetical protein